MKLLSEHYKARLDVLVGNNVILPDNRRVSIQGFYIAPNETIHLYTDGGKISKDVSELPLYLDRIKVLEPVPKGVLETVNNMVPMSDLNNILMESINKLRQDNSYAEQARTINETAAKLIDIAKIKIDAIRLLKDLQE